MMSVLGLNSAMMMVMYGLLVVLVIAWVLLPFALIGTKRLLRELIVETRKANGLLEQLLAETRRDTSPPITNRAAVLGERNEPYIAR